MSNRPKKIEVACALCSTKFMKVDSHSRPSRWSLCKPCCLIHPWRPGPKFYAKCEELGLDHNKWFQEHYAE